MTWQAYLADDYIDFPTLLDWCHALAATHPEWARLHTVGTTREGRPLLHLVIGAASLELAQTPAVWIDAGTHASEWTSVSAALYVVSTWVTSLTKAQDPELTAWFTTHLAHILPCVSPDGYQAMHRGAPYIRSSTRAAVHPEPRVGLTPKDIDGDGVVRWMRWPHPAGPYVKDEQNSMMMRPRTLDDPPEAAFFVASEGVFLSWDGVRWSQAVMEHGVDLNRNFPGQWQPSAMFGMDAGHYALSEPESRALVDTFAGSTSIQCALSFHTYTGCILTQPYRQDTTLKDGDLYLMEEVARQLAQDTDYKVYRVFPDFTYDPKQPIGGVWADTATTMFGVPTYTVEFWDPYAWAGVKVEKPAAFFLQPDQDVLRAILQRCVEQGAYTPWKPVEHPQLGEVEVGGIDYLRTVRNPPASLLATECEKGWVMAERLRHVGAQVHATATATQLGEGRVAIELVVENVGMLSTAGLAHAQGLGLGPRCVARLEATGPLELEHGQAEVSFAHLEGWGAAVATRRHILYPSLSGGQGPRVQVRWVLERMPQGGVRVNWRAGRAGSGVCEVAG